MSAVGGQAFSNSNRSLTHISSLNLQNKEKVFARPDGICKASMLWKKSYVL